MTRHLTKPEIIRLATIGCNTLRWFRESGGGAVLRSIDWSVGNHVVEVAVFDGSATPQPFSWSGLQMLVRMGVCAEDKTANPETFQSDWVDQAGNTADPWNADRLRISWTE